jgi:predicted aminopeptidase
MEDKLITEHAGTRRDAISRYYQYGSGGVRVLDTRKTIKRLYLFDPSSGIMTERDPLRQDKILRRFVFDKYGML